MKNLVKVIEPTPITAKIIKVVSSPKLASNDGKLKLIKKFVIHKNSTQNPIPKPRNLSGIISDIASQKIGPIKLCMEKRKHIISPKTT